MLSGLKAFFRLFYLISIVLTFALAGVSVVGGWSSLASPALHSWMPVIGLLMPAILWANLMAALYWIIRWRYWAWVPLLVVAFHWPYVKRVIQLPLHEASAPLMQMKEYTPNVLTVGTYNVGGFHVFNGDDSPQRIAQEMEDLKVDVLCMQEFGINREVPLDSLLILFAHWPYYYVPQEKERIGALQLAVFSRYPIDNKKLLDYEESNNRSLRCDIVVQGRTIRLVNNHLQTTNANIIQRRMSLMSDTDPMPLLQDNFRKRAAQAEELKQEIEASPHPLVVCGDFNSLPSSYVYNTIRGEKLLDGFQSCGHGYMYTFRRFKKQLRIDYIFHSPVLEGLDYFSPNWDYSDHKPVIMRMKI